MSFGGPGGLNPEIEIGGTTLDDARFVGKDLYQIEVVRRDGISNSNERRARERIWVK